METNKEMQNWNQDVDIADQIFNDAPDIIDSEEETDDIEVVDDVDTEEEKVKGKKKEEIDVDKLFDDDPEGGDDKDDDTTVIDSPTLTALNTLKERGIIEFELEEGEELTEEDASDMIEIGFENRVEARVEELFEELPKEVKELAKFTMNGGSVRDYLDQLKDIEGGTIKAGMDLTKQSNQEIIIREISKSQGYDDEFIEAQINSLKDSNKLEYFAKTQYSKWEKDNEESTKRLAETQRQKAEAERQRQKEFHNEIKGFVTTNKEVGGLKLDKKDAVELPSYLTNKNIKLQNGGTVTQFNKDLMDVLGNKEATIQLAKLLRNKNKDNTFNFSMIEKSTTTKVTSALKDDLRRKKPMTPSKSLDSKSSQGKSLADYF